MPLLSRIKRAQPLLGTYVEVTLHDSREPEFLHAVANEAFRVIRRVQDLMSFHDPASEVSQLNRTAHLRPLPVSPWTRRVLEHACQLSAATQGAFDITVAPQLVKLGHLPRHQPGARPPPMTGDYRAIEVRADGSVFFQRPLMIDLGGIAKGFAVDRAIEYLRAKGIRHAVVNAGGDLRVLGGNGQAVSIRDPRDPTGKALPFVMPRAAVATSAGYFIDRRTSPIIDPLTRRPLRSTKSVSVFAPTCLQADALTKTVFLAPQEVWTKVLADHDACCLILSKRGRPVQIPTFGWHG